MKQDKQSFLERLTGARTIGPDDISVKVEHNDESILSEKPWSSRVNDTVPEEESHHYAEDTVSAADDETELSFEEEDTDEEPGLAIDMYEVDNEIIIQSMIAGVTPENLHITITRDNVTIKGKRIAPQDIPEEQYVERELYWGEFSRTITLPFPVNTEGAEAVEKYGLLIIRLSRLDEERTQELKVKSIQ
jgi:HSP20 family protein